MTAERTTITDWESAPIVLKPCDVSKLLDLSLPNVYNLFHRQGFPTIRASVKNLRVEKYALQRWLTEQAGGDNTEQGKH